MAGLEGSAKRAWQEARAEVVIVRLRDGTRNVVSDLEVWNERFLAKLDLIKGGSRPESRFEEQYWSLEMEEAIVQGGFEGAWVRAHEDGPVETTFHEGGSDEAERVRLEVQRQGPVF